MKENCLNKLEYNIILDLLSKHSVTYIGKDLCLNLKPVFKSERVKKLLEETFEAINLIERKGNLPIIPIENVDLYIKSIESSYTLSAKGLLDIGKILKLSRELKDYLYKDEDFDLSDFTILDDYFSSLYTNVKVEDEILKSIIDEDTISDDASKTLASLRRNRRKLETEIKDTLNKMIHSSTYSKYIMEPIVTIRNDRYVIPVKEENRSNVKGYIHDISSSGSTVFIEPMSVFETNNKIANIKMEEAIEIEKILQKLSSLLFPISNEIKRDVELIGLLDFIFAKAKFAKSIDANMPEINNKKFIYLEKARHPLIDKDSVVPIDVEIGKDYTSLIITGPNTGGKTVTLKTVGLLTLMACSGLHIPAGRNSSIYVFDNVYADIGDEQSIQESLSTFSSHMINTINILDSATSKSLVLLDELGSGTDPVEGASLATAILERLNKLGCLTIATTHYHEIKNYALVTDGFENASSEFDIENLKPTYKLIIGIPGKSNAFAISKKLGLPDKILAKAKSMLNEDEISVEELLKNIYNDIAEVERQKEEAEKNLAQIEQLRKSLETQDNEKKELESKIIENAKNQAKDIVLSAKEEANASIKEIESIAKKWKELDTLDIDNSSDIDILDTVKEIKNKSLREANQFREELNLTLDDIYDNYADYRLSQSNINKKDLRVGMKLKIKNISDIATIISIPSKGMQVQVQIGSVKMNVKIKDIISVVDDNLTNDSKEQISSAKQYISSVAKTVSIKTEINVIGQNVDDACAIIDKYLDDAALAKLNFIRIVHGKGTGKLRSGIHIFLKKHPHVKSFRIGTFGEGEMGVTIVELK